MRITFVLPHANLSGGVRVVAIYAQRLRRRGHDIFIISAPKWTPNWKDYLKAIPTGNWPRQSPPEPSHLDGLEIPHRILPRRRPIVDADLPDADVVIATWWETAEWVAALSPAKGAKAYFIQHHEIHSGQPVDRVKATWRLPLHKITISNWLIDLAREEYGDPRAILIPNSVDMEQFHAPPRGKQARPTVGLLYSPISFKGCDIALEAIKLAAQEVKDLHLVAFGAEPVSPGLPLPPGSDFTHRPPQQMIRNLYAQCDLWLCASRAEGFHLPPLEAMACRCPVVSTRVGGPLDIIQEAVNGHLVDVGDAAGLARRMARVLQLPEPQWKQMSDAAHQTATRYTWEDATDRFEAALNGIAAESDGRTGAGGTP